MDKKEIIKLLDKKVGLFIEHEDENSLGELYITDAQFKDVELVLKELELKRKELDLKTEKVRKLIDGNKRFTVIRDIKDIISDKTFNLEFPIPPPYVVLDSSIIVNNCIFYNKKIKTNKLKTNK